MVHSSIQRYIEATAQDSWHERPFGEVDALILTDLAYLTFEASNLWQKHQSEGVTLYELHELVDWQRLQETNPFLNVDQRLVLLKAASQSLRFAPIELISVKQHIQQDAIEQFCLMTYRITEASDVQYIYAFRGTDDSLIGWLEDLLLFNEEPAAAQTSSAHALEAHAGTWSGPFVICGHSKGANLAMYAAQWADYPLTNLRGLYFFDGPSLPESLVQPVKQKFLTNVLHYFVPEYTIFGLLGDYPIKPTIVKGDGMGLYVHNLYQWHVADFALERAEQFSSLSRIISQGFDLVLEQTNPERLMAFVTALRDLFNDAQVTSLNEFSQNTIQTLNNLLTSYRQLPQQTKNLFREVGGDASRLIRTIADTYSSELDRLPRYQMDPLSRMFYDFLRMHQGRTSVSEQIQRLISRGSELRK